MEWRTAAAVTYALATAAVIVFQVALALGAPLGAYAMGGRYPGRFPPRLRVAALVQAALLVCLAVATLSAAGVVAPEVAASFPWLIWLAVAFSAVSLVLNAITPSAGERKVWVPVAVVMLVTSLVVAVMAS